MNKIARLLILAATAAFSLASPARATLTHVNPTPWPGEVDLAVIVAPYEADGWVRLSDALDIVFPVLGYGQTYLFAVEDQPAGDFDFNDWVGMCSWDAGCVRLSGYSAATHTVTLLGTADAWTFGFSTNGSHFTAGWRTDSVGAPDRIVTWAKPVPTTVVPEPGMALPLALGLAALLRLRRRAGR